MEVGRRGWGGDMEMGGLYRGVLYAVTLLWLGWGDVCAMSCWSGYRDGDGDFVVCGCGVSCPCLCGVDFWFLLEVRDDGLLGVVFVVFVVGDRMLD